MPKYFTIAALSFLSLALPQMAFAQGGPAPEPVKGLPATDWEAGYAKALDDKIIVSNWFWHVLLEMQKRSDPALPDATRKRIGEDDAKVIVRRVRSDGKIDAEEIDLLEEFAFIGTRPVTFQHKDDAKLSRTIPQPGAFIQPFINELNAMWLIEWEKREAGWPTLVKAFSKDAKKFAHLRVRLVSSGATMLSAQWQQSTPANVYKPFNDLFGSLYAENKKLPPAQAKQGQSLLFEAGQAADRKHDGKIPDYLYIYAKPSG